MKKIIALALSAALIVSLGACAGKETAGGAHGKKVVWKLSFLSAPDHPEAQTLNWLSDEFLKATDGRIRIEVNPNALLGDQKETLESLEMGVIQMAVVGNAIVEQVDPDFTAIGLPGEYKSIAHQKKVFTSNILDDLFKATGVNDFYVIAAMHAGVRNVYAKKPIRSPADLKGLKIRVQQAQSNIDMIKLMGGTPAPMSSSEVYTSIQTGVIDGAENNEVTYWDMKHYEVAPYYSYTRHFLSPDLLLINKAIYDKLSPADKTALDALVKAFIPKEFDAFIKSAEASKAKAKEHGATFIDDFDSTAFAKALEPLADKYLTTPERRAIYDKIQAMDN